MRLVAPLTNIHLQIIYLTATGSSGPRVRKAVRLKRHTVNRYWKEIFQFFATETKCGAIRKAIEAGFIQIPSASHHPLLFPSERKVLRLLTNGLSTNEIAAALAMKPHHVCVCISRAMDRYHVHSREHLVAIIPKL